MQKNIISRTIKNISIILLMFVAVLFLLFWSIFFDFKENAFINAKTNYELNIDKYTNKFKDPTLLFDKTLLNEYRKDALSTSFISNIKIKYNKILLSKESLIYQTNNFSHSSWNLADVTTDAKFGEIQKIEGTSFFEFIPSASFNPNEKLIIKYQLFRNNEIINFLVSLDLNLLNNEDIVNKEEDLFSIYKYFYNIKLDESITKELKIADINYASVEYTINDYYLKKEIYEYFNKLLFLAFLLFIPITIIVVFYSKYIEKKYVIEPIQYLDKIVTNIIEHKFMNINDKIINQNSEYKNLVTNISKLSNKIASMANELNINKESMERNLLTDSLTGLYDKKMFDIDMKSMFVSSAEGYIFLLKIAKLGQIENVNGSVKTDDFILSYVNVINNIIFQHKDNKITFYRIHGPEFIILVKGLEYNDADTFSNSIINGLNEEIYKNYKLPENIFHIGGTKIDKYGTIDSILDSVNSAYLDAVSSGVNSYKIVEENLIHNEIEKTEEKVKYIINNNFFNISFAYDSYSFDDELLLRELKPILRDENGNEIAIGSFMSISEKLHLNTTFDKQVIVKALEYIRKNKINYKIAINLSIKTIIDKEFMKFLYDLVHEDKNVVNNILFSITSYTASANKGDFVKFVKQASELKFEILLKRFKTKEYSLDDLSEAKINYIKIDKDLTQNIHNDLVKKHRIKNIVVYAEVNDIKLIVENVESDQDYKFLSKLDLYAVNR
ncbi:diguanylate cyclase/phosphodiesterase [Arcobacter acticola]|uniref:Diguanylate cyclase/phosphodiesterase n=1 Tax=Arcobacter acticola TaxID=1849015 RepID=A0A6M8ET13_9BACT|nr:EAL domain-containing protein [Arcobacter acticola]QKE27567.1 diguanylate cyclase/phosphodiesterase [Arcobacter acticola]